jgi:hypothetical protein
VGLPSGRAGRPRRLEGTQRRGLVVVEHDVHRERRREVRPLMYLVTAGFLFYFIRDVLA